MHYFIKQFLFSLLIVWPLFASADQSFLIDADWLAENIDREDLIILEVRYYPHRYKTVGHIPGAVQVKRFKDLGDNSANPIMRLPSKSQFQNTLRIWGVNNDSTIVIYDDSRTALASRVYYLLDLYGFNMQQVKVLNGGTIEWSAFEELTKDLNDNQKVNETVSKPDWREIREDFEGSVSNSSPTNRGNVDLKEARPGMVVEWYDIYDQVLSRRDPNIILLDARPHGMYTGEIVKHAIQAGHIPGAINIVSLDGTDGQSQKWLSEVELADMYQVIPKSKTVYVYCHDGFRMSLAYMQLKSLGYKDVRLYNGGWSHWGNRLTLPVVEGEKPYDEAYSL